MNAPMQHDPARSSHYLGDDFYQEIVEAYADWQNDALIVEDPRVTARFERLLYREARLLDRGLYEEWLTVFAPEFVYWVPGTADGGDPRREIAVTFDDRRRTEDRIFRFRTGYAWSQSPPSRTVHLIGNVEAFKTAREDVMMVRSNFTISEFWSGETRMLSGAYGHRFVEKDGQWLIQCKRVDLIECDQCLRNPSIVL